MDSEGLVFLAEIVLAFFILIAWTLSSEKRRFVIKDRIETKLQSLDLPWAARRFDVICKKGPKMMNGNMDALYGGLVVVVCGVCMVAPYVNPHVVPADFLTYLSMAAESLGLLMLRYKIRNSENVNGISGQSLCIFAIDYISRATVIPSFTTRAFCFWGLKVLDMISLILILDVLRCIFVTYRKTYQKEFDRAKAMYIVLGAVCLALVYHPSGLSKSHPFGKSLEMYLDTLALLPQIVMMVCQSERVQAPIAHFIAGTSISRISDLLYWSHKYAFWTHPFSMTFSMWVVISCHATQLLLVADFLYLYAKAFLTTRSLTTDIIMEEV